MSAAEQRSTSGCREKGDYVTWHEWQITVAAGRLAVHGGDHVSVPRHASGLGRRTNCGGPYGSPPAILLGRRRAEALHRDERRRASNGKGVVRGIVDIHHGVELGVGRQQLGISQQSLLVEPQYSTGVEQKAGRRRLVATSFAANGANAVR